MEAKSRSKNGTRAYHMLDQLGTEPNLVYLKKVDPNYKEPVPATPANPSGQRVRPSYRALRRLAPSRSAPSRSAPGSQASVRSASRRTAPKKSAPDRYAPRNLAPVQSANTFTEIYESSTVNADPLAGTGYNDGTLIFSGKPDPAQPSSSVESVSRPASA